MKIYRAMSIDFKTQGFGPEETKPDLMPFYQSLGLKAHNGYDWSAGDLTKLYWDCDIEGEVLETYSDAKFGLGLIILTKDSDGLFVHRFWHLKSFGVQAGQKLDSGDFLGYADNTGLSFGPHLHRDLKRVEKDQFGNYQTIDKDNGYFGCINPKPYFKNIFILTHIEILKGQISILQKMIETIKLILSLRLTIKR